ncbi:MAG: ComF family protein [Burkholderiales bacterium]|nr:MAG: ComF family protein [Betaproteobacteria bacterium]TAG81517.1 MAG: ComF family protein [Burkholderiales bacterium]
MSIVGSLRKLFAPTQQPMGADASPLPERAGDHWTNQWLPARCALCTDPCMRVVCAPCEGALVRVPEESCPRCKLPSSNAEVCGRCLRYPPRWDRLATTFMYEFPLDRLVVRAKHGRYWGVFEWAAAITHEDFSFASSTLIPVPPSPERLLERGYDQAALFSKALGRRFSSRVDESAIIRIRETGTQATRNWVDRRKNVKHAFAATRSLAGEAVVLVDDVLTTGATLNECARAAIDAGASSVNACVIARVNPPRARSRIQKFNRAVA